MTSRRNPYLVTLLAIAIFGALLAFVLALIAGGTLDPIDASALRGWATSFLQVAVLAALGALVAAAIVWRPSATPEATATDSDADLTPAERRFFTGDNGR